MTRCLEALLGNDLDRVEILVVDDASCDSTAEVARAFASREPAVSCLSLAQRSGPAGARNEGLRRARHAYLLFLDADVVLPGRALEWIRDTLELYRHRPDVVGVLGAYSEKVPWEDFLTNFKNLSVCFLYRKTDTLSPYLHTPIFCVCKSLLESVGGFDAQLATGEDFRLGTLLGSRGYRFVIDRRIRGVHWKRYSLAGVLREDWHRIRDLSRLPLTPEERQFAFRAHRWHRLLSLVLPGPILLFSLLAWFQSAYAPLAFLLLLLFLACNFPFLRYCAQQRGAVFALGALLFQFAELLWAEILLPVAWLAGRGEEDRCR